MAELLAERLASRIAWLTQTCLPLWAQRGVDPRGGFHERIDQDGRPVEDLPRRARVVARQTYVFATAHARGWGDYAHLVDHGAAAIFERCLGDDGLSISTYSPDGIPIDTSFDAYDQAFVLFALAALARYRSSLRDAAAQAAMGLLVAMRARYRHPMIGFEESFPPTTPLLQNPHMHLLEACLAWSAVPNADPIWHEQARELVTLATTRLSDRRTGAIHEFFDADWRPIIDEGGGWIEPGHQFEWAWLLWQWADRTDDAAAAALAARLYGIGRVHGVVTAGQTIDALDAMLRPRETSLRLWPQTERLKASLAASERGGGSRVDALDDAATTLACLDLYLDTPVPGLWFDRLDANGAPVHGAAPASSLYHVVCALDYAAGQVTDLPAPRQPRA